MKKIFMVLLISLLTCTACSHASKNFQITDEIRFSQLEKEDFIIDDYLYNNPDVLDFVDNEPDLYYLSLSIKVTSDESSEFTVKTINMSNVDDYLSEYGYEIPLGLNLIHSIDKSNDNRQSVTQVYRILQVPYEKKNEFIEGFSDITLNIEILNEENELITKGIQCTNFIDK